MRLGTSKIKAESENTVTLRVVAIAMHPNYYDLNGIYFDIGIAIPEKTIVYTNYIR
jgi:hypothetical protein